MLYFHKILGDCYYYLDHWAEAEKVYQKALNNLKVAEDLCAAELVPGVITKIFTQISNTKSKLGKFDEAIKAYKGHSQTT